MIKYISLCKLDSSKPSWFIHTKLFCSPIKSIWWNLAILTAILVLKLETPEIFSQILNGSKTNGIMLAQLFLLGHFRLGNFLTKMAKSISVKPVNSDHLNLSDISIEEFIDDEIRFTQAEEMRLKSRQNSKENLESDLLDNEQYDELWRDEQEYMQYSFELREISSNRNTLKQDVIIYFQTVGIHLFLFSCIYSLFLILQPLFG